MPARCSRLHGAAPAGTAACAFARTFSHFRTYYLLCKAPPLGYEYLISIWRGGGGAEPSCPPPPLGPPLVALCFWCVLCPDTRYFYMCSLLFCVVFFSQHWGCGKEMRGGVIRWGLGL